MYSSLQPYVQASCVIDGMPGPVTSIDVSAS